MQRKADERTEIHLAYKDTFLLLTRIFQTEIALFMPSVTFIGEKVEIMKPLRIE